MMNMLKRVGRSEVFKKIWDNFERNMSNVGLWSQVLLSSIFNHIQSIQEML